MPTNIGLFLFLPKQTQQQTTISNQQGDWEGDRQ
jgi:hypothetical protein